MHTPELVQLIITAEQCSPERHPAQAMELNQRIIQLNPANAAASVRLARAYQAQRQFAAAVAACQDTLQRNPAERRCPEALAAYHRRMGAC